MMREEHPAAHHEIEGFFATSEAPIGSNTIVVVKSTRLGRAYTQGRLAEDRLTCMSLPRKWYRTTPRKWDSEAAPGE